MIDKLSKAERKRLTRKYKTKSENFKEEELPYIYINEDGSARELNRKEKAFLDARFTACDGGRPYVKSYYDSRTPDNKMAGFLLREFLPKRIKVDSST